MKAIIFYSWQSDTRAAANRTLIQDALEAAARELRADGSISVEPVVDRDTQAVPGAPDIGSTILEKIEASAVMVADVTIVSRCDNIRPSPNPNVLIELGYALKCLSWRRIILVQNVALGGPEELPFDLRQKRALTYNSPEDAPSRAQERRQLQSALKEAIALVLGDAGIQPAPSEPVLAYEGLGNVDLAWCSMTAYVVAIKNAQDAMETMANNARARVEYEHAGGDRFVMDPGGWFLDKPPGVHNGHVSVSFHGRCGKDCLAGVG